MRQILFLLFIIISEPTLSKEREVSLDWETIKDAKFYEIQVKKEKEIVLKKIVKNNSIKIELSPDNYKLRLRSLDSRKVPGVWGEFIPLLVKNEPLKIDVTKETFNEKEVLYLDKKYQEIIIENGNKKESVFNAQKIEFKLENGENNFKISYKDNDVQSENSFLKIVKKVQLDKPKNIHYFNGYIHWTPSVFSDYSEVFFENKIIKTKKSKIKINEEKYTMFKIKSLGNKYYKENSEYSEFLYDPKIEKYISLPKKRFYFDYKIGAFFYENSFLEKNSFVEFKNISGESTLGFQFGKKIETNISLNYGGFLFNKVPVQYLDLKTEVSYKNKISENKFIDFGVSFFRKEYFNIYSVQNYFIVDKKNQLFLSGFIDYQHVFNQNRMSQLKIDYSNGYFLVDSKILFKQTNNLVYSLGFNYVKYSINSVNFTHNYLHLGIQYWLNQ